MGTAKGRLGAVAALVLGLAIAPTAARATEARATRPEPARVTEVQGAYDDVAGAQLLAEQINADRVANGLRPLEISAELTSIAQAHSRRMAAAGKIWHNDELFSQSVRSRLRASRLGENVGFDGGGAATSHQMYMDSPPHRANILDPRFTAMGIAVTVADGIAYSTEDFMQVDSPPPPPPRPAPVAPAPAPPAAPPTTEPVVAQAAPQPAAPAGRTGLVVPTRRPGTEAPAAAAVQQRLEHGGTGRASGLPIPEPLAAALCLVNAALAWATVLTARSARRTDWAVSEAGR